MEVNISNMSAKRVRSIRNERLYKSKKTPKNRKPAAALDSRFYTTRAVLLPPGNSRRFFFVDVMDFDT